MLEDAREKADKSLDDAKLKADTFGDDISDVVEKWITDARKKLETTYKKLKEKTEKMDK